MNRDLPFPSHEPLLPSTYMHDILRTLDLKNTENVVYTDLSEHVVSPPPYGFLIGEDQYAVGSLDGGEEGRFLYTKGLLHCTAIAFEDRSIRKALLAHIATSRGIEDLVRSYADNFPDLSALEISIVPGFERNARSITRIQNMVKASLALKPKSLLIDLAHGEQGTSRDIMLDVLAGRVAQVAPTPFTNPIYQQA